MSGSQLMQMSAIRQLYASIAAKSSQLFAGTASFSRHIGRLNGLIDVGHARADLGIGGVNEDEEWLSCLRLACRVVSSRLRCSRLRFARSFLRPQRGRIILTAQSGTLTCITPDIITIAIMPASRASSAARRSCRRASLPI